MRGLNDFAPKRKRVFVISLFAVSFFFLFPSLSFSEEKVQYLKKVGEIKDGFSSERENFFIKITGLCCDDEGNLYVADSGWNKIFKFDSNGKFLMSFGREGQGPGEFMGQRMSNHLKISFGNDGKLYVNDPGNSRISVFTKEGKFLKSHRTPSFTYDTPVVNSRGDIYLLSKSGIKIIDSYDPNFKLKASLLDYDWHLHFPLIKPSIDDKASLRPVRGEHVQYIITKKDKLVVLSNFSLGILVFDRQNKKINEFSLLKHRIFYDIFKTQLEESQRVHEKIENKTDRSKMNVRRKRVFLPLIPLKIFIYGDEIFGLLNWRGKDIFEIYFLDIREEFLGRFVYEGSIGWYAGICSDKMYFYVSNFNYDKILILKNTKI